MATLYGPDINSKHGDGSILNAAWAAGERFVAIKAGGGNVGLYQAPHYVEQLTLARKLGFKIVHYFPSGNQPIATQASYALRVVKPYWRDGDAIGWDNEKLDSTGQIRNDRDSASWINLVRAGLGCPPAAVWHYGSSGSTFRDHGPWPLVKATGCTIWAAAYPGPPDMAGTGLTYDVHQYTSTHRYAGSSVDTDRNKTARPLSAIFPKRAAPVVTPAVVTPPSEEPDVPVFYKEKSHPEIYAISWVAATKTHLTRAQWIIARTGPHSLVVVPDGSLAAFK